MADAPADTTLVRVTAGKGKYRYADFIKLRMHEGKEEMTVSALGSAMADAVSVVELLKFQGVVVVKKIKTDRAILDGRRSVTDRIEVVLGKSADFDKLFAEQEKEREAARTRAAEEKAE